MTFADPPKVGDTIHLLGAASFVVTYHGPFELATCVDCGHYPVATLARAVGEDRPPYQDDARCSGCERRTHGLEG